MMQNNNKITNSEYETLISKSFKNTSNKERSITTGKVISIENDVVTVDVGLKSEGRIPLNEFSRPGHKTEIEITLIKRLSSFAHRNVGRIIDKIIIIPPIVGVPSFL